MAPSPANGTPPKASKQQQLQRPALAGEPNNTLPQDSNGKKKKKNRHHEQVPMAAFAGSENGEKRRTQKQNPRNKRNGNKDDTKKAKRKQLSQQDQVEEEEKWRTKKQKLRDVGTTEEDENTKKKKKEKDEKENKWKKRANEGDGEGLIRDLRFASAHWDPRFQSVPKRESKVVIDSRFSRLLADKRFGNASTPVDKRGRPVREKEENPFLRYYLLEEEVDRDGDEEKREADEIASGSDEESTSEGEASDGSGGDSDTSSSEEEESSDEDDEQYAVESDVRGFWMGNQEDTPTIENETRRLAVLNMDWDHIKAVDLYILMSTCLLTSCPQTGGQILSVAIYPSEFGQKCMEIEAIRGPHALFDDEKGQDDSDEDDDIDDVIVNEKIRSYQLKRLKYYYAVVDCNSSATANHLYNALDGVEFLRTANVLDLRFIPDSMEFTHPPRDIATEAPADYKQPDFETLALQHSTVKLTWDDDEPNRKKILRHKFNSDKMDDLEQYLASEESDDDNDESDEGHGEKYHALLQPPDASGTDEDNDSGKEMEVTFLPGVENLSKHIDRSKLNKSEEGVWEAYLRKRREKMKARKKGSKFSSEDESNDSEYNEAPQQPDDFFVEEPSGSDAEDGKRGGKKHKLMGANKKSRKDRRHVPEMGGEEETKEASRAELELLLANDDAEHLKGFNLRPKKVKRKKGKEVPVEDKLPEVDASNDSRFSSRLISHLYALDPTEPEYKRSAAGMRQAGAQKQQKGNAKVAAAEVEEKISHPPSDEKPLKENHEMMSLVRSLKLKSKGLRRNGKEEGDV